jgi:two-component system chemotaxis response regulator CheY
MPKCILVADDSSTIRKFMAMTLKMQGFRVITVADGMEALEMLPKDQVDLIITDLNMPNIDGFEFIRMLRTDESYRSIPVIILSSLTDENDIQLGLRLGANSYLVKPFNPKRVLYEVSKYLN